MQIAILHLSDIHLKSLSDPVAGRALKIKEAVLGKCANLDACFIVITGDVANTGASEEYDAATAFLQQLRSALLAAGVGQVEFAIVPGNHDGNLRRANDTRAY